MKYKITYLIKFIPEEAYVDSLINQGEIFMRPLGYFSDLVDDDVRGDVREGLILDCIRISANQPIYCMYAVFENETTLGKFLINKRAVQNFLPKGEGFFAIIKYSDFIMQLRTNHFDIYSATANIVKYGSLDWESQEQLLLNNPSQVAFVKKSDYSYQQEFRLIIHKNLPMIKDVKEIEKYKSIHGIYFSTDFYTYDYEIKHIGSLEHCARKFSTKDLIAYDDTYFLLKTSDF